jgi:hypothetical protein
MSVKTKTFKNKVKNQKLKLPLCGKQTLSQQWPPLFPLSSRWALKELCCAHINISSSSSKQAVSDRFNSAHNKQQDMTKNPLASNYFMATVLLLARTVGAYRDRLQRHGWKPGL